MTSKPCPECKTRAGQLNRAVERARRAESAIHDLALKEGDGSVAHLLLGRAAWADVAAQQRDEWRGLALLALARLEKLGKTTDEIRLAWKNLGDDGLLELVFCAGCVRRLEDGGVQMDQESWDAVARIEQRGRKAG